MTRVAVIGNAGGGKSRLSRALGAALGLPYHAIDWMQWRPGWLATPEAEFTAAHEAVLAGERWVIDGLGSWDAIERRFRAADTIILVDLPFRTHLWWATKRQIKAVFGGRTDGPEGCPMLPVTFRLYRMMWRLHRETRPRLLRMVDTYRGDTAVVHLRSPQQLADFLAAHT